MSKSHWVTHEQLDTPLCDIFPDAKSDGTARHWVFMAEIILKQMPKAHVLEDMSYEDMNEYMDYLDEQLNKVREELQ